MDVFFNCFCKFFGFFYFGLFGSYRVEKYFLVFEDCNIDVDDVLVSKLFLYDVFDCKIGDNFVFLNKCCLIDKIVGKFFEFFSIDVFGGVFDLIQVVDFIFFSFVQLVFEFFDNNCVILFVGVVYIDSFIVVIVYGVDKFVD